MPETIESFVAKLQTEGVEAGRQAAAKLQADAETQARKIVADAQAQAKKLLADADVQARQTIERAKGELALAARDTMLSLRKTLSKALTALLADAARKPLTDVSFLGKALHEIVGLYSKADQEQETLITINVSPEIRETLISWAVKELGHEIGDHKHPEIDLRGTLSQAGFEYEVHGATVEVTVDSVVETLSELISPALAEILDQAVKGA